MINITTVLLTTCRPIYGLTTHYQKINKTHFSLAYVSNVQTIHQNFIKFAYHTCKEIFHFGHYDIMKYRDV